MGFANDWRSMDSRALRSSNVLHFQAFAHEFSSTTELSQTSPWANYASDVGLNVLHLGDHLTSSASSASSDTL